MLRRDAEERRNIGAPLANGTMMLALLTVVALVALPASQTPPPSIAELSPNAQEQITEEQPEQSSSVGEGEGGEGREDVPGPAASPEPEPEAPSEAPASEPERDPARLRACVGNPPRQTEDPHSPPCVSYWEGDNGGATAKGVTATEIRIACGSHCEFVEAMVGHFNTRFEFYGRKLVVFDNDTGFESSPEKLVALADRAIDEIDAFASTMIGDKAGNEFVYYDRLAEGGVVSVQGNPPLVDEAHLASYHPYQWSYMPTFEYLSRNKAEWICSALAGGTADFADGTEQGQPRRFGLVVTNVKGRKPDTAPMKAILSNCGVELAGEWEMDQQYGDDAAGNNQANNVVLELKSAGVTSVICECHTQSSGFFMSKAADQQVYNPEWLVSTYYFQTTDAHVRYNFSPQMERHFGLQWWNKQMPRDQSPWYWALKGSDPNYQYGNDPYYDGVHQMWGSISLLAAGLQLAGPNLTPETFAQGLLRAEWPNPDHGQAPYWQADVGFVGTHSFIRDAALVWGSRTAPSSWGGQPGAFCYAQRGVRYQLGSWPSDYAGLYEGACY